MKIFIEANSYRRQNGKWIPRAIRFLHEGNQTWVLPYVWLNQECDDKESADLCARFGAKQTLIRNGYSKEEFLG